MIEVQNLCYSYPNADGILKFPDMVCAAGEALLVIGASGVGKTTLLHLVAGLIRPLEGSSIRIDGQDICAMQGSTLDTFRGQRIGIVFQKPYFVQALTCYENLLLAPYLANAPMREERANMLLDKLGIAYKANKLPKELSVGEQQRLSIARAVMNKPALILADEPTSALDDVQTTAVANLLQQQAQDNGSALIIVTHDHRLKERFNRVVAL